MTFQKYRLDALTTELWETRGEQGHILGSDVCDTCPAILQGSTCYLHFIQVTIHLSFIHIIYHFDMLSLVTHIRT